MANPLLGYFVRATPTVVKESFKSYVQMNPALDAIYKSRQMKALTGTNVQIPFINARHSQASEISAATNWQANSNFKPIFDQKSFDWGQYAAPIVLPQENEWRAQNPADWRMLVNDTSACVVALMMRDIYQHVLMGGYSTGAKLNPFNRIGTLNGAKSGLSSSGLTRGALIFDTPANQAAGSYDYLNRARSVDTKDAINNWYNQFYAHAGIGPDFFKGVETIQLLSRQFRQPGGAGAATNKGISLGLVPLSMLTDISAALRQLPGTGNPQLMVTVADLEAGKGVPAAYSAGGVSFEGDYFWDLFGADLGMDPADQPCILLDPSAVGFYIQKGHDFALGPLTDMSRFGQFVYMAWMFLSLQFVVHNPLACGVMKKA